MKINYESYSSKNMYQVGDVVDNKVTAIDRLAELMKEYDFPIEALKDVIGRISSWQGNTNDDPYLWQQVRYFEELIKQGYATKRK